MQNLLKYSKTLKINGNNFFKLLIVKFRQNWEIVLLKMYSLINDQIFITNTYKCNTIDYKYFYIHK